jgi:hypothetical protein
VLLRENGVLGGLRIRAEGFAPTFSASPMRYIPSMPRLKRAIIFFSVAFVLLLCIVSLKMALRDPEEQMSYSATQFWGGVVLGPLGIGLLVWLWES